MKIVKCVMRRDASVLTITPPLNRKKLFSFDAQERTRPHSHRLVRPLQKKIYFFFSNENLDRSASTWKILHFLNEFCSETKLSHDNQSTVTLGNRFNNETDEEGNSMFK